MDLYDEFYDEIKGLTGKICWHTALTVGSTLMLDFGRKLSYDPPMVNPKSGEALQIGEFNLLIFCSWRIEGEGKVLCTWKDKYASIDNMEFTSGQLQGKTVKDIDFRLPSCDMEIRFSGGLKLNVFCDHQTSGAYAKSNYLFSTLENIYAVRGRSEIVKKGEDIKRVFVT